MTSPVTQAALLAEGNGMHDTLKPWLTGGGALLILLLLLVVTVSFNKDR
ncbi:hypothetical protein ABH931_000849 [Streptacidiphilus sp. MAP12-33]